LEKDLEEDLRSEEKVGDSDPLMARGKEDQHLKVCEGCLGQAEKPYYLRVRSQLQWWKEHGASKTVLDILTRGIPPPLTLPCQLQAAGGKKNEEDQRLAQQVLREYQTVGAVKLVGQGDPPTKFLVPWFIIQKPEGLKTKLRLITDCRRINQFYSPQHFKLDHLEGLPEDAGLGQRQLS
jgi:hypothetical protein